MPAVCLHASMQTYLVLQVDCPGMLPPISTNPYPTNSSDPASPADTADTTDTAIPAVPAVPAIASKLPIGT